MPLITPLPLALSLVQQCACAAVSTSRFRHQNKSLSDDVIIKSCIDDVIIKSRIDDVINKSLSDDVLRHSYADPPYLKWRRFNTPGTKEGKAALTQESVGFDFHFDNFHMILMINLLLFMY